MIRIGMGRDLHRLVEGRPFLLGGVRIPTEKGELGHSDADVLAHAVTDAILGASGLADIGSLFPPSDPTWKDADSMDLLRQAFDLVRRGGWRVINLDCVVTCEQPKILNHREAIRASVAAALTMEKEAVFVKGKTNEGLDSLGKGEAVEALAVCLLENQGPDWPGIFRALETWKASTAAKTVVQSLQAGEDEPEGTDDPSVSAVALERDRDPWAVLVSTIISLRTKDEVTLAASRRVLERGSTPQALLQIPDETLEGLLFPAGFYRTKARTLKTIGTILLERYQGRVPDQMDALLALPGVGRKTANLVLAEAYDQDAICVDTHVHRICNRAGWVATKNAEETEQALRSRLPVEYWKRINYLLVLYGQRVCRPQSPHCSVCPLFGFCQRVGVQRSR
jgi:endonuclease-3